jgi:hypothetical protein
MDCLQNSIQHFCNLSQNEQSLIHHYTCEIDPDDWNSCPLLISYQVINFILKQYYIPSSKLNYVPDLISQNVLSISDIYNQIINAQYLKNVLDEFPSCNNTIIVYKGMLSEDYFFKKSCHLSIGSDITIPYFISTSVHFNIASRFTEKNGQEYYWKIIIPSGFQIPFIRKDYSNSHEGEILINIGAIFRITSNHNVNNIKIITLMLTGFSKCVETRNFWKTIKNIAQKHIDLY